jgi:hypothetical protein
LAIRNPRRGRRAVPSSLGIHSPEDRRGRGIPNSLGTHSSAAHSSDIRILRTRRPGSRNRCPVGVEVYSRLLRRSRLPLRSLLQGRLPARHPPLLRWQHQKPLPIRPHQGRVEQDHKGWCRPRGPTLTRQSYRAQFGSLSLFRRPSTGLTDNDNGYIAPFLSTNPALRLCEPEGLAAVGLENLLGKPVRIALVETVKSLSALDMAHQRASEWFYSPRISHPVRPLSVDGDGRASLPKGNASALVYR